MNAQVTAIKHRDVFEKDQFYIKIETAKGTSFTNVGIKTYEKIVELTGNIVEEQGENANQIKADAKGGKK